MGSVRRGSDPQPARVAVSGLRTDLHALHLCAWLRATFDPQRPIELISIDPDARCAHTMSRMISDLPRRAVIGQTLPARPDVYVSIGAPSPRCLLALGRLGYRSRPISLDEGIGAYGSIRSRYQAMRREGVAVWRAPIRAIVRAAMSVLIGSAWHSYRCEDGVWTMRDEVRFELHRRASHVHQDPRSVVFLMQPWALLGVTDRDQERQVVEQLQTVVTGSGRALTIVPHPADPSFEAIDVEIVRPEGLAELSEAVLRASVVIGETTTSLINLAAGFDHLAIRVDTGLAPPLSRKQQSLINSVVGPGLAIEELARDSRFTHLPD